jgi:ABC-type multidrug transport system fused ATPase/permease subunit
MMLEALLDVFRPWPLKIVIDRVLSQRPSRVPFVHAWLDNAPFTRMQILYGTCAATIGIALLAGLLAYYHTKAMGDVGQHYVFGLRCNLFAHLQRLSLRFHDRQRTGDLTLRLMSDIKEVQDLIAGGIASLATNVCLLIGMLALMLWVNWKFALVSLCLSPLLFVTSFLKNIIIQNYISPTPHLTSVFTYILWKNGTDSKKKCEHCPGWNLQ